MRYLSYFVIFSLLLLTLGCQESDTSSIQKSTSNSPQTETVKIDNTQLSILDVNTKSLGQPSNLPLPHTEPYLDYKEKLDRFIQSREYVQLGWMHDKEVRDTGPFLDGQYYGTHPAVFIYYSPEAMQWLANGRTGTMPDGAMIIKEMFTPPAAIYKELNLHLGDAEYSKLQPELIGSWTVMIKDSSGSQDGWYWASVSRDTKPCPSTDTIQATAAANPFDAQSRDQGFALPCMRCHASAKIESTFISTRNIAGLSPDEDPLRFLSDTSWRREDYLNTSPLCHFQSKFPKTFFLPNHQLPWSVQSKQTADGSDDFRTEHDKVSPKLQKKKSKAATDDYINQDFINTFGSLFKTIPDSAKAFPSQWFDHIVQNGGEPSKYITSDNCIGCHGGLAGDNYAVTMFVKTGEKYGAGYDVSEYSEWRWSPMGLAGRDPIFHAQLESEMAYLVRDSKNPNSGLKGTLEDNQNAIRNTCLSCHGAMGQRTLAADAKTNPHLDANFKVDYFYFTEQLSSKKPQTKEEATYHEYGALARDGISCMICHHIAEPSQDAVANWNPTENNWINNKTPKELAYLLFHNNTGHFDTTPSDVVHGPYDVKTKPMEHTLAVKPEKNSFIQDSQLCGTCHTINLPNIGATESEFPVLDAAEQNPALKQYSHSIEQATFLEWQNSKFAQPSGFQSCQDCHMSGSFESLDGDIKIGQLMTQIATIEDSSYPEVDKSLPNEEIDIAIRDEYSRHTLVGLNGFLVKMFEQFESILGVSLQNEMTTPSIPSYQVALESMIQNARDKTVDVDLKQLSFNNQQLKLQVTVNNKTGHRFPSGVAFRRAFIELKVNQGDKVIWSSGATNDAGVIVDMQGNPLTTEFLTTPDGYQPHHQIITKDTQVQIYEELTQNNADQFTTSFVHRVNHIKDNRLLPDGWRQSSFFKDQGEVMHQFMQATDPLGVGNDPDYQDSGNSFIGKDSLLYQIDLKNINASVPLTASATLYFQAIPPYWLKQRFEAAPDGDATKRLFYISSRLELENSPLQQWKFKLVSKSVAIK
ncbi:MAG: cytochrome P460 family protein [Gammaproteobacteria bacterium]|nr:cytochrome P460 family protein [Gammaproteobacteria bacterium]